MAIAAGQAIVPDGYDPVGNLTATWVDPTGVQWPLTDNDPDVGWFTRGGPAGWGAIKYEVVTDPVPRGGETIRFIRAQAGRITWPLHIHGEDYYGDITHMRFLDRYRSIKRAFLMTLHRGLPGQLIIARQDGSSRVIDCFYEDGFGGEAGENHITANPTLTLYCPDGYWRDPDPIVVKRSFNAGGSFWSPFPNVSPAGVLGNTVITNPGDVTAWPVWTITGPATQVTAQNITTGYQFIIDYTLNAGETITITTLQPSVRGPVGQNLITALELPTSYLWPLIPDLNEVNFNVAGAGAGTAIELTFDARYEGA